MNALVPKPEEIQPCPKCGDKNCHLIVYSDTVDFRGMELDVENLEESKCSNCGCKWTSKEQREHNNSIIRASYAEMRDKLREKDGLLSGYDIAQIRQNFGLNQREAAALFGGGYNAFHKYESGEVLQSFAMDRLLRLTSAIGKPAVTFLKNVFSPPNFIVLSTNDLRIVSSNGNDVLISYALKPNTEIGSTVTIGVSGSSRVQEFNGSLKFKLPSNALAD
jgi:putative zinc finger/helix-turn-helix YgiT family protein